jgi:glycosyltransferase involved in cell wall biosynthesis
MIKMDYINILLATYNGENFLSEQLDSLLTQTFKNFKIYICDDNSNDSTLYLINKYINNYPDKIILVNKPTTLQQGAKYTFDYLLKQSSAKYIMFCDQDDVWINNKIEVTLNGMKSAELISGEHTPLLIHCDLKVVDESLNLINESFIQSQRINPYSSFINLLVKNSITGCTVMINRAAADGMHGTHSSAIMHDWWIALYVKAFGEVIFIDEKLILYRQHKNNVLGAKKSGFSNIAAQYLKLRTAFLNGKSPLDKYHSQGKAFLENYQLPSIRTRELLFFLEALEAKTWHKRLRLYINLNISKGSKMDDFFMAVLICLHKLSLR